MVLLFFCGCGHLFHGVGDENRALFQERVGRAGSLTGSFVYNGDMECRGRSYPFILGLRLGESESEFHFYSPSGDVLYAFTQKKKAKGFSIVKTEEGKDGYIPGAMRKFIEDSGDEVSLPGIILGGFPRVPSGGSLYGMRRGFIYEGENFTLRVDDAMKIIEGELSLEDGSVKVHYTYGGTEGEIPSGVDLSYTACRVHLLRENITRGNDI